MILKEFIEKFIERNTLIRLVYKDDDGGHCVVLNSWNDVSMEHDILNNKGKYKNYANNNVIGVTDILVDGHYSEAVNIVIEKIN